MSANPISDSFPSVSAKVFGHTRQLIEVTSNPQPFDEIPQEDYKVKIKVD